MQSKKYYLYERWPIDRFPWLMNAPEVLQSISKDMDWYGKLSHNQEREYWDYLHALAATVMGKIGIELKIRAKDLIDVSKKWRFFVFNPLSGSDHTDVEIGYLYKIMNNGTTYIALPYKVEWADEYQIWDRFIPNTDHRKHI